MFQLPKELFAFVQKFVRELEMWHALSGGPNIIELLGTITGIGPLPALVCALCTWNLDIVRLLLERRARLLKQNWRSILFSI
jgi:hypothetical protein